jgi:replicative DNA helicase
LLGKLTDPAAVQTVWELGISSEVFQEPICAAIYDFIISYWQHEQMKMAPTALVIAQEFQGVELPVDQELSTTWLAEQLRSAYFSTNIQEVMMEAAALTVGDPEGAVKLLRERTHHMAETMAPRHSRSNMATSVEDRRRRYFERSEEGGLVRGVTLGVPELDDHVSGCYPGELVVLGAFAKTGKTWYLCQAVTKAREAGLTPIFFTLEMTKEEIEDRLDAMHSGLSYNRLSRSRLTVEELERLHPSQEQFARLGDVFIEQPEEGDRTVAALISRARHLGADYVVIDQLSFVEAGRKTQTLKEHHSLIMSQLKKEIGRGSAGRLPCLLAVQLNRESQRREGGIGLDSFANATEIEAACDLALGLWRNEEMERNRTMKLEILGSRRSPKRSWLMYWDLTDTTNMRVLERL